jgi:sec-independent protein translocase protein TatA
MAMFGLGTPEIVIILVIVLVLFGPKQLPKLGKSLGATMKSIREGAEGKDDEEEEEPAPAKPKAKTTEKAAAEPVPDPVDVKDGEE